MKKKFKRKKDGVMIRAHLPTQQSCKHKDSLKDKVKIVTSDKQIVAKSIKIPESDTTPGGRVTIGFLDIDKLIEIKKGHNKRVVYLEKILPFQVLELELPSNIERWLNDMDE